MTFVEKWKLYLLNNLCRRIANESSDNKVTRTTWPGNSVIWAYSAMHGLTDNRDRQKNRRRHRWLACQWAYVLPNLVKITYFPKASIISFVRIIVNAIIIASFILWHFLTNHRPHRQPVVRKVPLSVSLQDGAGVTATQKGRSRQETDVQLPTDIELVYGLKDTWTAGAGKTQTMLASPNSVLQLTYRRGHSAETALLHVINLSLIHIWRCRRRG